MEASQREEIAHLLERTRARTLALVSPLSEAQLRRQPASDLGPVLWDLGHIAAFEELWLVTSTGDRSAASGVDPLYDPFEHPRPERTALPLPAPRDTRLALDRVRRRALERLFAPGLPDGSPLLEGGFVYHMVAQHEGQHQETMLQSIDALAAAGPSVPVPGCSPRRLPDGSDDAERLFVPGGRVAIGTDDRSWAYDNERPRHEIELRPFLIDRFPATNARFRRFVEERGYARRELWTLEGWARREAEGWEHPLGWVRGESGWQVLRFGRLEPLEPAAPVQRISFHEAAAFARWAGGRLPSEQEWEAAARSRCGAERMLGDGYEWTASVFAPYPGFAPFPYRAYSEPFFSGGYRILRGSSWAAPKTLARVTYRNWDRPQRRRLFAGVRLAWGSD